MITCNNCGRENEDEYKFCLGCGSALPDANESAADDDGPTMLDCPHCGTTVPSNFKFCGACGGPINAEGDSETVGQPAQPAVQVQPAGAAPAATTATNTDTEQTRAVSQATGPTPANQPAPSTADDTVGRLIVIRPDGSEGPEISLTAGGHTVGRNSDHDALANDPFLSPRHATFSLTDNAFRVRDEDSLNGVFVRIRDKVELNHGDMIRVGQELLRFELLSELTSGVDGSEDDTLVAGSPVDDCWGRLCLMAGPDIVSRAFALGDQPLTLGRQSGEVLFRDDGFVSGSHARVTREHGGAAVVEDLGSSNGTYRRIRGETEVDDGDLLLIGQQLFRVAVL